LRSGPKGDAMIIGVSRDSIQRNVLPTLYKILGFPIPTAKTMQAQLYGRTVYFVGAHDESSVRKIQGSTLAVAYVDEATCIPLPFWRMLLSRLSISGSQLFATCNPEGPAHWLKKDFIDRAGDLDLISWHFTLDDNPSLDESYKTNLKKEYSGMWYARYILGEWTVSHGLIYDMWSNENIYTAPKNNPHYYVVGCDYGTTNATAAVLIAVNYNEWPQLCVVSEFYYDSAIAGRSKTDAELVDDIKKWIYPIQPRAIYVDPAAASFKLALSQADLNVLDGNNDVLLGIKLTGKYLANLNLLVNKSCKNLIEQIQTYQWDAKAAERGEDKPVKKLDHLVDALRYCICTAFKTGNIGNPNDNKSIKEIRREIYGDSGMNDLLYGNF
jgi:PBSX family phage terminase large subunit